LPHFIFQNTHLLCMTYYTLVVHLQIHWKRLWSFSSEGKAIWTDFLEMKGQRQGNSSWNTKSLSSQSQNMFPQNMFQGLIKCKYWTFFLSLTEKLGFKKRRLTTLMYPNVNIFHFMHILQWNVLLLFHHTLTSWLQGCLSSTQWMLWRGQGQVCQALIWRR
jgi:hypothetical protein